MQLVDHYSALRQVLSHHGWGVVEGPPASGAAVDVSDKPDVQLDSDDEFAAAKDEKQKMEWAFMEVHERGDKEFFDSQGPELAAQKGKLSGTHKRLQKVYFLCKPFRRLPSGSDGADGDADEESGANNQADGADGDADFGRPGGTQNRSRQDRARFAAAQSADESHRQHGRHILLQRLH